MNPEQFQIVELGRLSMRDWADLVGNEAEPFGGTCARFAFRPKDHHVALRDNDGTLVAAGGWTVVNVEVEARGRFEVIGLGALIVRRGLRGRGLASPIMDRLRDRLAQTGVAHRLVLCEPHLEPLYARRGYRPVEDPVWVDQPAGPVRWPLRTLWRSCMPSASWPAGVVRIEGPPF